jgi:hypothetical protein
VANEVGEPMSQRESTLLWLRDMLEHLGNCQRQLSWTDDAQTVQVLTESMIRDLECCRRLCESIHQRAAFRVAV